MEKMNVVLASKTVDIAEYKNYVEITNRVCYYNEPNGNGVRLPYDDNSLTIAQSLVDMPVQAKYTVNENGEPDLLDHCVAEDNDGNILFLTESIGTHTKVWIENDTVETFSGKTMELPCLFAKQKIWKRYPKYIAAITKLFNEGNLHNSWEVSSFEYNYDNGIKTLISYVFEGNAYLGSKVTPAYGNSAKALEISQKDNSQLMVASALAQDMSTLDMQSQRKEETDMENKEVAENVEVAEEIVAEETSTATEDTPTETEVIEEETSANEETQDVNTDETDNENASLTAWDLYEKIHKAVLNALDCVWVDIYMFFPDEKVVWVRNEKCETETDLIKFVYSVENDEVQLGEPEFVKLTVTVPQMISSFAELSANVQKAAEQIETLSSYKEKYEELMLEIETSQKAEKRKELKQMIDSAKCLSKEEKNSEELASYVENCNEEAIKLYVGNKYICSMRTKTEKTKTDKETKSVSASLVVDKPIVSDADEVRKFINS